MLARGELVLARILIVSARAESTTTLRSLLASQGFTNVAETSDQRQVVPLARDFRPDLILVDPSPSRIDPVDVLSGLRTTTAATEYLPTLVVAAAADRDARHRALAAGAADFLSTPFDPDELALRIGNLLRTRFLHRLVEDQTKWLRTEVAHRTAALELVHYEICERLARAAEFRDDDTGEHTRRVGQLAKRLARAIGMEPDVIELLEMAAPLHDVGKIGVPDRILLKPGKLDPDEQRVMRRHPEIGATLLGGGQSALLQLAEQVARGHHERWDGRGYPHGLAGDAIPLPSRVVAVADFFDAMTHDRPYRPAWPVAHTLAEMRSFAGQHFDPRLIEAFLSLPEVAN